MGQPVPLAYGLYCQEALPVPGLSLLVLITHSGPALWVDRENEARSASAREQPAQPSPEGSSGLPLPTAQAPFLT